MSVCWDTCQVHPPARSCCWARIWGPQDRGGATRQLLDDASCLQVKGKAACQGMGLLLSSRWGSRQLKHRC